VQNFVSELLYYLSLSLVNWREKEREEKSSEGGKKFFDEFRMIFLLAKIGKT